MNNRTSALLLAQAQAPVGGLQALGLSPIQESVYRALLRHPGAHTDDLARHLNVEPGLAACALAELEVKGIATCTRAAPPDVAVELLLMERQAELNRARLLIPELQQEQGWQDDRLPDGGFEVIDASPAVQLQAYLHMFHRVRREMLCLVRPPFAVSSPDKMAAARAQARARGVHMRTIVHADLLSLPGWAAAASASLASGEELRVLDDIPFKLLLADGQSAMLPLHAEAPNGKSLMLAECAMLDVVRNMFETMWQRAAALSVQADGAVTALGGGDSMPPELQAMLTLLAAGANDKAIASTLNISQRTLVRRMNEMYAALAARSRFHAGWLAASRVARPGCPSPGL